jgi:hypothetical protein
MKKTTDQYDDTIPDDLVVLSGENPADMTKDFLKLVKDADWYEANGVLLVSAQAVGGFLEVDPVDCGIDLAAVEVLRIDNVLKRWSYEDGFYHA